MNAPRPRNLRQDMPKVAAWIDSLREAFGAEGINSRIRDGMAGVPVFHACENGLEVGTPLPTVRVEIGADRMVIIPKEKK